MASKEAAGESLPTRQREEEGRLREREKREI